MTDLFAAPSDKNRRLLVVAASLAESLPDTLTDTGKAVAKANSFSGEAGQVVLLPDGSGADALLGLGNALFHVEVAFPRGDQLFEFSVLTGVVAKALLMVDHLRIGQQHGQLFEPVGKAV